MNNIQKKTYIDNDKTDSMGKKTNKQMKKNKLCAHTITWQARITSSIQYYQWFVTKYTDKNEWKWLFNHISHHTTL